jgi:PKD repeat protein
VPLSQTYTYSHTYAKAGTYTITFTAGACSPLTEVTKTVEVTVG